MSVNSETADCYQDMYNYLSEEHNLILTITEMEEIISYSLITINLIKEKAKTKKNMRIDRRILLGKKAKYTYWGLMSCAHGMYANGGFNLYIYGIKGIFNIIIHERCVDMACGERNF